MARNRLTRRRRAVEDSIPYPGSVNQPDRKFKTRSQYDDWKEVVNHPLPDMRTDWRGDSRDNIGFGIPEGGAPTVAAVKVAANKSVRLAVLLLGDKVADEVIEEQARDLMAMSQEAMDRTLQRFAETQELYVAEDKEDDKEEEDDKKEASEESKEAGKIPPQFLENVKKKKEEAKDNDKKDDDKDEKKESKKAEDKEDDSKDDDKEDDKKEASFEDAVKNRMAEIQAEKTEQTSAERAAAVEAEAQKRIEAESKEDDKEDKKEDKEDDSKEASDKDETEGIVLADEKKAGGLDIELTSAVADEAEPDPEADKMLASVLFDDEPSTSVQREAAKTETKKAGIKKLGGQPKVASSDGSVDISSIWNSAPDVSEVFG